MAYCKEGLLAPDRYAFFEGTSLRYRLSDPSHEWFVSGRKWIRESDLRVGDQTYFGKVYRIGPLEEEGDTASV